MSWYLAWALVRARGLRDWVLHRSDRTGLTVRCDGCACTDPHDAHLARGALTFLSGRRR